MRPRQSIIDIFSTFLQLETDRFRSWIPDSRLRRSMQQCLNQFPEEKSSETFWAIYWHKQWQQSSHPALGHLSAHLQETCYWSAQRVAMRLEGSQHGVADCFQVAIAEVPKILRGCDPNQPTSLKTYANTAFGNIIRDYLRQRREVDRCSDWGLLLKISRKQLLEALQHNGLNAESCDRYWLAWSCFSSSYAPTKTPGQRQTLPPDAATWKEIVQRYNVQRQQLADSDIRATAEQLEKWLTQAAKFARAYLYPAIGSLNVPRAGQDSGEMQDDLPDPAQSSLLTELIAQEEADDRQIQQTQLNHVLTQAVNQLDATAQDMLQLYYQQGLTQQQMAQQLGVPQYKISRKLAKARETLLLALSRWSEETLHTSPTSNVIKYISTLLEEWLQMYYQGSEPNSSKESQ
jgi:RNA polymerase sigma factor (sigma-70 family)